MKGWWFEQADILMKACNYIRMLNPLETNSSIIGMLFNSFLPVGIPFYAKWVTGLNFPYVSENNHLIFFIKNIWNLYSAEEFEFIVSCIDIMKRPYVWVYPAFSYLDFRLYVNEEYNGYFKDEIKNKEIELALSVERKRIDFYYKNSDYKLIGGELSYICELTNICELSNIYY